MKTSIPSDLKQLIPAGARKQMQAVLAHPVDSLRAAMPGKSGRMGRLASTAGLAALATTRRHPVLLATATVAALGLGWMYWKRQRKLAADESTEDAGNEASADQAASRGGDESSEADGDSSSGRGRSKRARRGAEQGQGEDEAEASAASQSSDGREEAQLNPPDARLQEDAQRQESLRNAGGPDHRG